MRDAVGRVERRVVRRNHAFIKSGSQALQLQRAAADNRWTAVGAVADKHQCAIAGLDETAGGRRVDRRQVADRAAESAGTVVAADGQRGGRARNGVAQQQAGGRRAAVGQRTGRVGGAGQLQRRRPGGRIHLQTAQAEAGRAGQHHAARPVDHQVVAAGQRLGHAERAAAAAEAICRADRRERAAVGVAARRTQRKAGIGGRALEVQVLGTIGRQCQRAAGSWRQSPRWKASRPAYRSR